MLRRMVLCALAALLTASCVSWAEEAEPFTGTWKSQGHGLYMTVAGDGVRIYEHTSVSCAKVLDASAAGVDEVMSLEDGRLLLTDWSGSIVFDQAESLPDLCRQEFRSEDPSRILEVLVATFEENYAFLDERDPEWETHVAEAEDRLGEEMSAPELLVVMEEMLGGLGDPQVLIIPAEGVIDEDFVSAGPENEVTDLVGERIAAGTGLVSIDESSNADGGYVVGRLPSGIGYLGLLQLLAFDSDLALSKEALAGILDELIAALQTERAPGLVIDLRDNVGGFEQLAVVAASRFLTEQVVVARHEVRIEGTDAYADCGEVSALPGPFGSFDGPVVVLVGPGTKGTAEWLVLALMQSPNVVVVGETTAGSLSPLFARGLPNGWAVYVPHERVYDAEGNLWEMTGIPPDEEVELTIDQLEAGNDPVLERAVELLLS